MAVQPTIVSYPGDGSTTNYTFQFDYLSTDYVVARVDGTEVDFTFTGTKSIELNTAPEVGTTLVISRETERERLVEFIDGSVLIEDDLNLADTQLLHIVQEALDLAGATLALETDGSLGASFRRISSVADPVEDNDAVTKEWAETAMSSQLTSAISAKNGAVSAEAGAAGYKAEALIAKANAESAEDGAEDARDDAEAAQLGAETAQGHAEDARDAALGYRDETEVYRDEAEALTITATNTVSSFTGEFGEALTEFDGDVDSLTHGSGFYQVTGSATGTKLTGAYHLIRLRRDTGSITQEVGFLGSSTYYRAWNGSSWSDWDGSVTLDKTQTLTGNKHFNGGRVTTEVKSWDLAVDGSNLDAGSYQRFDITLAAATNTIGVVSTTVGQSLMFILRQDATGGRTVTWGSNFKWPGGTAPTLSTDADAVDIVVGEVISASEIVCNSVLDMR